MTESYLDGLLDELVLSEPRERWDDVVHRARRAQRRYTALVLAVAMLVLASCSWVAVRVFEGTPAPPPVRGTFRFSNRAFAEFPKKLGNEFPQAEVDKAHGVLQVQTKDGPLDLWAAPSTDGGTCFVLGLENEMTAKMQLGSMSGCTRADTPPISAGTFGAGADTVLDGYATGSEATAQVTLTNGRTITLPVVEHFFLGSDPGGLAPASITGRDRSGKIVASWKNR
jgi:hypothetical protein